MVSLSKLYFTLRKKLIACIRVTRYNRKSESSLALGNTHGFHENYARFFAEQQLKNFNPYFTEVGSFCFYFRFANTSKGEQSDEIRHSSADSSFKSSETHEAACSKIHRSALHSQYKYKQMSKGKTTKRTKCQILPSAKYCSYHAGVSPEGWTGKQSVFLRIQVPRREQSNKRSETRLKRESETGKRC